MSQPITLLGEPVETLRHFLRSIHTSTEGDGAVRFHGEAPREIAVPFLRALMRQEARLLRDEADHLGIDRHAPRTADERRADALIALIANVRATDNYSRRTGRSMITGGGPVEISRLPVGRSHLDHWPSHRGGDSQESRPSPR